MSIATINPATGETLRTFTPLTPDQLESRLECAVSAYRRHRRTSFADRRRLMLQAADILEKEKEAFGRLMVTEMGKPLKAAIEEAAKCALGCRYYAEHAERFLADEVVETSASKSWVAYQPIGPVLAVMPWNFPFWQVFRFAAPALMAGNVGLLKHASNVPQCGLAIEEVFRRAGFPAGCFQTLLIESGAVKAVIEDPRVAAVTLTGSEGAGISVGRTAGEQLKKAVLELGGSDPFLVLPSADVAKAAETAVKARTINNGQSCIAAKRFIVHRDVADEFIRRFVEGMAKLRVGDPLEPATEIGPLATPKILEELEAQVQESVAAGTAVALGGTKLERPGNFYAPTVLVDPPRQAPVYSQETFGPVATVFRVASLDEAIALANATEFGLGASAWSRDPGEQERLAREIEAGSVFLNGMVKSDPRLPFGGIKRSGFGRELAEFGIREFVNVKSVWIA
jgi:succinate-semialdehyde dehydrogenase/glutarate-semialdehyde dehydrogenase